MADDSSFYHSVGGEPTFDRLVEGFYAGVARDEVLVRMYSTEDLTEDFAGAKHRMASFLAQYFGGPRTYSDERGHPRLRMRHAAFPVDADARDRWLRHIRAAVRGLDLTATHEAALIGYFERAAHSLVNR